MDDAQLNRIGAVGDDLNTLSHEVHRRIDAASIASVDHYREVLRRLETMHDALRHKD